MKQLSLLVFCYIYSLTTFCQTTDDTAVQRHTIYFSADKAEISPLARSSTLDFLAQTDISGDFQIKIYAHTDSDGSDAYNAALSERRAEATTELLTALDIYLENIKIATHGEQLPAASNSTADGKRLNRRVVLEYRPLTFSSIDDLWAALRPENPISEFEIDPTRTNTVAGSQGMVVHIPPYSFVDSEGNFITSEVKFTLEESLNKLDWAMDGLSCISDGKILESGGMVKLSAQTKDQTELKLGEGQRLTVRFPTANSVPENSNDGFRTFVSATGTDWETDENDDMPLLYSRPVPHNMRHPDSNRRNKYTLPAFERPKRPETPNKPARLIEPRMPKKPHQPVADFYFRKPKPSEFFRRKRLRQNQEDRYTAATMQYEKRVEEYEAKLLNYEAERKSYPQRKLAYKSEISAWEKLDAKNADFHMNTTIPEARRAYEAWVAKEARLLREKGYDLENDSIYRVRYYRNTAIFKINELQFEEIKDQYLDQLASASELTASDLQYYTMNTGSMGWINCDRFYDIPAAQKQEILVRNPIKNDNEIQCFLICEDINSMMRSSRGMDWNYKFQGVPQGLKGTIVALRIENGKPMMAKRKIDNRARYQLSYEPTSMREIKQVLM